MVSAGNFHKPLVLGRRSRKNFSPLCDWNNIVQNPLDDEERTVNLPYFSRAFVNLPYGCIRLYLHNAVCVPGNIVP